LEAELTNFMLANTRNSFTPSGMLKLPRMHEPESQRKEIQRIQNQMTGTGNAGRMLVTFADVDKTVEWIPFTENPGQKDVSAYLQTARENIIMAHRLPSPTLLGLPGGASLGGDGGTIESASKIFHEDVILTAREKIIRNIESLLGQAGYENIKVTIVETDDVTVEDVTRKIVDDTINETKDVQGIVDVVEESEENTL
jgi:capsid portal protein